MAIVGPHDNPEDKISEDLHALFKNNSEFQLVSKLGGGATSFVCKAKSNDLERDLAVKIFIKDAVRPIDIQREIDVLTQEGSLISSLTVENSDKYDLTVFSTPLFKGVPLSDLLYTFENNKIIKKNDLSIDDKNKIAISLLKELYALQLLNVLHRDLKPDNILVDLESGTTKILDFGAGKNNNSDHEDGIYASGLAYLAPECIKGEPEHQAGSVCNFLTDEYALGIILADLYSNQNYLHEADVRHETENSPHKIMNDILGDNATSPEEMPPEIFQIIRHLSCRNPNDRAENVALANGIKKSDYFDALSDLQDEVGNFRKSLIQKSSDLPENIKNIILNHEDLSSIRNALKSTMESSELLSKSNQALITTFIDQIDQFSESKARTIQHNSIIANQGAKVTISIVNELQRLSEAYRTDNNSKKCLKCRLILVKKIYREVILAKLVLLLINS